jgi:hypothetical protein
MILNDEVKTLPTRRMRPKVGAARPAEASCRLDTRTAEDGPIQVQATVESTTGKTTSAVRTVEIRNDPPENTSYTAPKWFSATSFWNRPLPASTPLAANSAAYTQELVRQVDVKPAWINSTFYSTPVYTVGADQPLVTVTYKPNVNPDLPHPETEQAISAVPVPAGAQAATGDDKHMVIWQPSTDKMWEFWHMEQSDGQWSAQAAGAMEHVSTNIGRYDWDSWPGAKPWWGATGTSLPLVGGLITIEELEHRSINHALAIAIPEPATDFVWPAQRADGHNTAPAAIPEGTIFRLPADLDIDSLDLPPALQAIAKAAQRYGMVVRDATAYNVALFAEDPTQTGTDPYPTFYKGESPRVLLGEFPWEKLEAVAPGV